MKTNTCPRFLALTAALVVGVSAPAAAETFQRSTLELGLYGAHFALGDDLVLEGVAVDARITAERTMGIQIGYAHVPMRDHEVPARGHALQPDLRAELVIAPLANPYFSPFLTLGGGLATYADGRISLLAGAGAEIMLGRHLAFSAVYRLVVPQPFEVAEVVREEAERKAEEAKAAKQKPEPMPSVGDILDEHYNTKTYEVMVGVRLVY